MYKSFQKRQGERASQHLGGMKDFIGMTLPTITVESSRIVENNGIEGGKIGDPLQITQTGLGAYGFAYSAKEEIISYAAKLSPTINEMSYVKAVKVASKGLFAAQAIISGVQVYNAWEGNDKNKLGVTTKAGLDITIGYFSLVSGPFGWGVGGVYFIGDTMGLWGNWGQPEPIAPTFKRK